MTTRRFSSHELYRLRNGMPVEIVIKNALDIPCRNTEGCFSFLCPLCNEFDTAVNPETNLARCYLVMLITKLDFVKSVRFLKDYQKSIPDQRYPIKPNTTGPDNRPVHIGNILKTIIPPKPAARAEHADQAKYYVNVFWHWNRNLNPWPSGLKK